MPAATQAPCRAASGRASPCCGPLLANPRALLLDEPFSKLDGPLRARFRKQVFDHARARHLPTLLVTHDPGDADATDGRVLNLMVRTDTAENGAPGGT